MSSGYNNSQDKDMKVRDFTKGMRQEEKSRGSETCVLKIQRNKKLAKMIEKEGDCEVGGAQERAAKKIREAFQ